ncbi:hypothetical protein ACFFRR_000655 [Megaselia abdita]
MNKFGLIVIGVIVLYCNGVFGYDQNSTDLVEEGRRKGFGGLGGLGGHGLGFHGYHHIWGAYALAALYFFKIKAVIVAFFVGAAAFWGFKYLLGKGALGGCGHELIREGPIIGYDDHISYNAPGPTGLGLSGIEHSPYSYHEHDHHHETISDTYPTGASYGASTGVYSDSPPTISKRSVDQRQFENINEDKITNFMFNFLGLNSKGCRRRFICEMEFRSSRDALTAMAFRIVGRGLFGPYLNGNKNGAKATSFQECATVNPDCTVIEEDEEEEVPEREEAPEKENVPEEEVQEAEEIDDVENAVRSQRNGKNHLAEIMFSRSK